MLGRLACVPAKLGLSLAGQIVIYPFSASQQIPVLRQLPAVPRSLRASALWAGLTPGPAAALYCALQEDLARREAEWREEQEQVKLERKHQEREQQRCVGGWVRGWVGSGLACMV